MKTDNPGEDNEKKFSNLTGLLLAMSATDPRDRFDSPAASAQFSSMFPKSPLSTPATQIQRPPSETAVASASGASGGRSAITMASSQSLSSLSSSVSTGSVQSVGSEDQSSVDKAQAGSAASASGYQPPTDISQSK